MNKFVFHPVGQGLFYTGSLNNGDFKFVYDCGTANNPTYLNKEIDNCFSEKFYIERKKDVIDFIVISHMHKDHYSGLRRLLKKYKIDKLYLPYLGDYDNDSLILNFYYDIYVNNNLDMTDNERNELYGFMLSLYIDDMNSELVIKVNHNMETQFFKNGLIFWQFNILYNKPDSKKVDEINKNCKKLLEEKHCNSMKEFINRYGTKEVSNAYRKVFKNGATINNTSIMLLHYPIEKINRLYFHTYVDSDCQNYFKCLRGCYNCRPTRGVTLLTGDIILNATGAKELKGIQIKYAAANISVLQIPHHGAEENWNSIHSNHIDSDIYIIPFGYGNPYKHPSVRVIDDLTNNNMEYYCVTQNQGYVYWIR